MRKKILIVEDNPDLMFILQLQLNNRGYNTILAKNGKQAVDMAAAQLPNLIMMDILMPEMNGLEATRLIRQNPKTHSIPILAVTAKITIADKEECLQSGCNDHIDKPFTIKELVSRIEKLLKSSEKQHTA